MAADSEQTRRRLARLAWLLDNSIGIPGTRFRIGLDPLIGLIPGLGDLAGVLLSSYIVREAARVGAPPSVLGRMIFNVALESTIGLIPLVGDLFDAVYKANQRNIDLLESHMRDPRRTATRSRVIVGLVLFALLVLIVLMATLAFVVVRALWQALFG